MAMYIVSFCDNHINHTLPSASMDFEARIIKLLHAAGVETTQLEIPPDSTLGHYAFPTFQLAKERKKAPSLIAQELAASVKDSPDAQFLDSVVAMGPYVNFFIKKGERTQSIISAIFDSTFWPKTIRPRRILIEYPSPNTNKPLHLGHVRNMVLGSTLSILLKHYGEEVIQVNLTNDRGVHICKSMLAYQRWGENQEPVEKSDFFVGKYYVRFAQEAAKNPALEEDAQDMLVKWETGDSEIRTLWSKMNQWALSGHAATYQRFNIRFDKEYYESDIYLEGKQIVLDNLAVLEKDESGAIIANLARFKLPNKVLLRKDGTSIYMTQDIALTIKKMKEFNPDLQIWIVGNEQILHFQQLFAVLELFDVKGKESLFHLSYGTVSLPDGRMKSREGNVVDADTLLDELEALAAEEIHKRHEDWSADRTMLIAKAVAMGSLRFFMIKYDPMRDFVFNPESSLSFEGDTGAYLQYTHARICSILAKTSYPEYANIALLIENEEQELLNQLNSMPSFVRKAVDELKPSAVANQLLEICRASNGFYHACPVLNAPSDVRDARLHLLNATRKVLADGLTLLGIDAPEEM